MNYVRASIWKRTRRLYVYHLGLLLFVFTVVAGIACFGPSQALRNFLGPLFHSPVWASICAPLLLYQPPLMDILPMYIAFLALTPLVLQLAARRGWLLPLLASALMWIAAQLQVGRSLYDLLAGGGYPLPRNAWSSFDWFAWQVIWMVGLWLGSRAARPAPIASESLDSPSGRLQRRSTWVLIAAICAAGVLLCARHHIGGLMAWLDLNQPLTNKWHLGPLRLVNFALLSFLAHRLLLPLLHSVRIGALELLGRSSLQVFTAHIPVCILANGFFDGSTPMAIPLQVTLLALMLGVMLLVAWRAESPRIAESRPVSLAPN